MTQPSADKPSGRDELAKQYLHSIGIVAGTEIMTGPDATAFKAGWSARDEEVKRLQIESDKNFEAAEKWQDVALCFQVDFYDLEEENKQLTEANLKLREALEKIVEPGNNSILMRVIAEQALAHESRAGDE